MSSSSSSSSPSPPPPPLSLSSNHPLPMRSRITPADVARAYMITPPPENNHEHHDNQVFSRCLLKINDNQYAFEARLETLERRAQEHGPMNLSQEWELERERHGRRRSTSELDFIHGQIETAMDPLEDKHTSLEQRLENIEDAAASQKGNMSDRFDELSGEIDAVEVSLSTQIKDLAKSTDLRFSEVTSQIDEVSSRLGDLEMRFINSRATMLNGLASRPNDIVTPLSTIQRDSTGQSVVTAIGPTGKMVKWWWKLRRPERYEKLLEYHKFLQLDFREWTGPDSDSDSESEDDDDDLDPQPLPKSLAEAIQKNQEKAVKILFGNMGLSYTNFDELFRRNYEPVPPPKRALSYQNQRSQRRVDPQGELRGPSYWGSPTVSIRGAGSPTAS